MSCPTITTRLRECGIKTEDYTVDQWFEIARDTHNRLDAEVFKGLSPNVAAQDYLTTIRGVAMVQELLGVIVDEVSEEVLDDVLR